MDYAHRNDAKRFIILIDTLYDHSVKLVASARAQPDALYPASEASNCGSSSGPRHGSSKMRSQSYLALPHGRRTGPDIETGKIVET